MTTSAYNRRIKEELSKATSLLNNSIITNLSDHLLTENETQVLSMGLGYSLDGQHMPNKLYMDAIKKFERRINLKLFFNNENIAEKITIPQKRKHQSEWNPPPHNNANLTNFFDRVYNDTSTTLESGYKKNYNLTKTQREALKDLKANKSITIKKADKGGSIVVLNTIDYENKINEILLDDKTYRPIPHDPTPHTTNNIISLVDLMLSKNIIDEDTASCIRPEIPCRTPLFYGLPKIHKPNAPLRPIISACNGPSDFLSNFITKIIQPLAESLPAYLKDTNQFLSILEQLEFNSPNFTFVTADVTALYTNIPHNEGIEAVKFYMDRTPKDELPYKCPSSNIISFIIDTILTNTILKFNDKHYRQIYGTSMGTRMAPPYANLFMGRLDAIITEQFPQTIKLYKRFIDDIFIIFTGSREELLLFKAFMNDLHPTIKFTFNHSDSFINFLDITIYKNALGQIHTTLYRKPTDTLSLLHFNSHHPPHIKTSIIYSQVLRYNRLISEQHNLITELKTLTRQLILRGYPLRIINEYISKGLNKTQSQLIHGVNPPKDYTHFIPLVTPYGHMGIHINKIIKKHWHIIEENPELSIIFPIKPTLAHSKTKTIRDIITQTAHISAPNIPTDSDRDDELFDILINPPT
jgi:hypothetical protein